MFQIRVEFVLRISEDHAIQQSELSPDPVLWERSVADPKAVGIKKPLNGVFKHPSGFRLKAIQFTGIQNFLQHLFICRQSVCSGVDGLTDFFLTQISISFFFLT